MTKPKDLAKARPMLFRVAPLTATICWLFAFINVFVAYSLFFAYRPTVPLLFVNNFLNFQVWGILFMALAITGSYNLVKNYWNGVRRTLLAGIIVKAAWELTLIFRVFSNKNTILLAVLWGFFTLVQVATYVFFLPEITEGRDSEQQR